MFSFSQLGNFGRLGNQLFQIAATYGIAKKHNVACGFPAWPYSEYFQKKLPAMASGQLQKISEPHFHFADLILDRSSNIDLHGYFQSEKYFKDCIPEIWEMFQFTDDFIFKVVEKLQLPEEHNINGKLWCAVSVRRGDYVGNANYAQIDMRYYRNAIYEMEKQIGIPHGGITCIVFSDDIAWCKDHFNDSSFVFTDGFNEIESMALLSLCDHFIITNSTFAWWGAWLGEKQHSKVIVPDQWFGKGMLNKDTKDIVPERWIKIPIDHEDFKNRFQIDLKDVTFTIPVKKDSEDRKQNIEFIICFLQKHFDTTILVSEMDTEPRLEFLNEFCKYKFYPMKGAAMERTRLLNIMAKEATTPIIFNYDTDVLFEPDQILEAVNKIRTGQLDGCYPYDGRFIRLERDMMWIAHKTMTLDEFHKVPLKEHEEHQVSFGGAVAWNRDAFISGGMENEHMVSFGPEDYERYERFVKLGYKVGRVPGKLFHIHHYIGTDSNKQNPYFIKNEEEFFKIKNMSSEALRQYVNTWPWINTSAITPPTEAAEPVPEIVPVPLKPSVGPFQFDMIYCLTLEKRKHDRFPYACSQFDKNKIGPVKFINGVDGKALKLKSHIDRLTSGMIGCFQSHYKILEEAIENKYESICIFEDDLLPCAGFNDFLNMAVNSIPEDWQFVYLGYQEHEGFGTFIKKINDFWVVPKSVWGTQAFMIRGLDAIKKIFDGMQVQNMQIDEQLTHEILPKSGLKYYAIYPSVIGQAFKELGTDVQEREQRV